MNALQTTIKVQKHNLEDDMYIYGDMETPTDASWKYSGDRLKIRGSVPGAKGSFADLKFGDLTLPTGETKRVVVKMNKRKASKYMRSYMYQLIQCCAKNINRYYN